MAFVGAFQIHAVDGVFRYAYWTFIGICIIYFNGFIQNFKQMVYPILLINQTIPTIAIAPLLVIWLGYGILPKVVLVVLSVFFPMTIALLDGYGSVEQEN